LFFVGTHSIECAGNAGDERDEVVEEFFLCGFVSLIFDDGDGDAVLVEESFEVGEAKASESVLVGEEDATVIAVLDVVEELGESATVFVASAADISVSGFDRPAVVVCVVSETITLAFEVAVFF